MKSLPEVMKQFDQAVLKKYDFSEAVYSGALVRIEGIVCPKHGGFSQYSAQLRKGRGCPQCGAEQRVVSQRMDPEDFFCEVARIHDGQYTYQGDYVNMQSYIYPICPEHGEFRVRALKHYYAKHGCGKCETEKKRTRILKYRHLSAESKIQNTAKTFFDNCGVAHEGKYTYPDQEYKGAKESIRVICEKHGEFEQNPWKHLNGSGCPKCGSYLPQWEVDLSSCLSIAGFQIENNARILDGQEIDIYIPDKMVGIELHGLRWHTDRTRDKTYHYEKWRRAQGAGIRLIQVFEDEWVNKQDIVLSRLDAVLGRSLTVAARKCQVLELDHAEAKRFIQDHHIQGAAVRGIHYGLSYEGDIVAVASFCPSRSGAMVSRLGGDTWEVLRYASKGRVQGGFSRLLAAFRRAIKPSSMVSYCDLRYGDGALYKACGFTLDGITEPDYWWVPPGKTERVPRYRTQRHKLANHPVLSKYEKPGLTEAQICKAAGWERIYGVGSQRWVWTP